MRRLMRKGSKALRRTGHVIQRTRRNNKARSHLAEASRRSAPATTPEQQPPAAPARTRSSRMETTKYAVDKKEWERGPWDDEPDLENLTTVEGFDALVFRASWSGNFCGYVGVPSTHPWYGKEYGAAVKMTEKQATEPVDIDRVSVLSLLAMAASDADPDDEARIDCIIRVHGGLTYSGFGRERFGEKPGHWYFGFDCAHAGDLAPAYAAKYGSGFDDRYRDIDYVRREIAALSKQLAEVQS